jgi:hypothetical protein
MITRSKVAPGPIISNANLKRNVIVLTQSYKSSLSVREAAFSGDLSPGSHA